MAPWLVFDPATATLDAFLHAYPPSRIPNTHVEWIAVRSSKHTHSGSDEGDVAGLQHAWHTLCETAGAAPGNKQPSAEDIQALAIQHRVLSGKWMLFPKRSRVDDDWRRIASATVSGYLGSSAKVSPMEPSPRASDTHAATHLVCVYVDDFTNARDVWRVHSFLRCMGFTQRLDFKLDAYTHLNIYRGNAYGIPAALSMDSIK